MVSENFLFPQKKLNFFRQILIKVARVIFYRNSTSGNWVAPCGKMSGHTAETEDLLKLIVAFRNFGRVPKMYRLCTIMQCWE